MITGDVADIDSSLQSIKKLGGQSGPEEKAGGRHGFTAYFKDTEGNVVGLWQSVQSQR